MEKFEGENLSEEQRERQEKFAELSSIMASVSESFIDSNEAYEVADSINGFKKKFEGRDFELEDYLLGGVLLSADNSFDQSKYAYFDTEDGEREEFIRSLKTMQDKKAA